MSIYGNVVLTGIPYLGASIWDSTSNPIEQGNISSSTGANSTSSNSQRLRTNGYIPVIGGATYTINCNLYRVYVYFYNSSQGFLSGTGTGWLNPLPSNFTAPSNAAYIRCVIAKSSGSVSPSNVTSFTIQPNFGGLKYIG